MGNIMMSAPPERAAESRSTESQCVPQTVSGTLSCIFPFESLGGTGHCITSPTVRIGGHSWYLEFYPDGHNEATHGFVSIFLVLLDEDGEARALFQFRLVEQTTKLTSRIDDVRMGTPEVFSTRGPAANASWGVSNCDILERSKLERSAFLSHDNHLLVECEVTVIKEPRVVRTLLDDATTAVVKPPLRSLTRDLANLQETMDEADVVFHVKGQVFLAHATILAARSPAFKARLHDSSLRKQQQPLIMSIEDTQPDVFKALLHFIYTDSMRQSMKRGLARGEKIEFTIQLLMAAHRYGVEKLKYECETFLCRSLDAENAATMFALAQHHDCTGLRAACIEFITYPENMAAVVGSEGYSRLKDTCPGGLLDLFGLRERDM